jgi:hypothetical protein
LVLLELLQDPSNFASCKGKNEKQRSDGITEWTRGSPASRAELQRFLPSSHRLVDHALSTTGARYQQTNTLPYSFTSTPFFCFSASLTSFDFRKPTIKASRSVPAIRFH